MKRFWVYVIVVLCLFWALNFIMICDSRHSHAFVPIEKLIEVVGFFPTEREIVVVKREEFIVVSSSGQGVFGTEWNVWQERYIPHIVMVYDTTKAGIDSTAVARIKFDKRIPGRFVKGETGKDTYRWPKPEKAVADTTKEGKK